MKSVFFYGLFMDVELLRGMGFDPVVDGSAALTDYRLLIASKATLVAAPGSITHGVVMRLPDDEVAELYAAPGVADYRPEPVTVVMTADRSTKTALCYNLPAGERGGEVNSEYAKRLAALAKRLGFPKSYVDEILRFCGESG